MRKCRRRARWHSASGEAANRCAGGAARHRGGEEWLASGKLGKGGRDVRSKPETFRWNPAGNQSRLGSWPSTQKRVLRCLGVTQAAKRRQRVPRPCYRAPKFV